MSLPQLTAEDVSRLVPDLTDVGDPICGGQKIVFSCRYQGDRYVIKFLAPELGDTTGDDTLTNGFLDEVTARASREVETMKQCTSPYLVKPGPLPLTRVTFNSADLLYFTEEFVEGEDLDGILARQGLLPASELATLARNICGAISELWGHTKVHRDIKPKNIRKRVATGEYVLLDMGMAFDLADASLTAKGLLVGTPGFYSPEQLDFAQKRQLDFRADLFLLGIVLYLAATGVHPFSDKRAMTPADYARNILVSQPRFVGDLRAMPAGLCEVIMRLLAKRPHLRYRTCGQLDAALSSIEESCRED